MAKKRGQLSLNFDSERGSKLFGMFLLFLSFYLFIAFTSYIFTWENDHDIVFRFSWEMFLADVEVDNWLGRLGAYLSDSIIYWGFGMASYVFVYLLYKYGLAFIRRVPMGYMLPVLQRSVIVMVIISILASFFLQKFEFPWGGVFGQAVTLYVQNLLGIIGTMALMLFLLVATFVWSNNPNLDEFSWRALWQEVERAFRDLASGNFGSRRTAAAPPPVARVREERVTPPKAAPEVEAQTIATPAITAPVTPAIPTGAQLAFDLAERSALFAPEKTPLLRPESLTPESAELEINLPTAPPVPVLPEEATAYKRIRPTSPNPTTPPSNCRITSIRTSSC
jgi:DNA segregation ATPase FtsK/SpoIIIE, S-DNA-T family